jgi:tryptophan-rich hypothetical protein
MPVPNRVLRNKLIGSQWSHLTPRMCERHFYVVRWVDATEKPPLHIEMEAVLTKRRYILPYTDLTDAVEWAYGWR